MPEKKFVKSNLERPLMVNLSKYEEGSKVAKENKVVEFLPSHTAAEYNDRPLREGVTPIDKDDLTEAKHNETVEKHFREGELTVIDESGAFAD